MVSPVCLVAMSGGHRVTPSFAYFTYCVSFILPEQYESRAVEMLLCAGHQQLAEVPLTVTLLFFTLFILVSCDMLL